MLIGEKIKAERLRQGLKQVELARKANISNSFLADIEGCRVNPSLKSLAKLAKALNTESVFFIAGAEILDTPDD
jgi:transcriptional regulator with XRE-family HTH domain